MNTISLIGVASGIAAGDFRCEKGPTFFIENSYFNQSKQYNKKINRHKILTQKVNTNEKVFLKDYNFL